MPHAAARVTCTRTHFPRIFGCCRLCGWLSTQTSTLLQIVWEAFKLAAPTGISPTAAVCTHHKNAFFAFWAVGAWLCHVTTCVFGLLMSLKAPRYSAAGFRRRAAVVT